MFLLPIVAASLKTVGLRRTQSWLTRNALAPMRSADRTDASECPARGTNGGGGLPTASSPQQLSSSHNCTLELVTTARHRQLMFASACAMIHKVEFQSHAWLEWNGEVINDAGDVASQYLP